MYVVRYDTMEQTVTTSKISVTIKMDSKGFGYGEYTFRGDDLTELEQNGNNARDLFQQHVHDVQNI